MNMHIHIHVYINNNICMSIYIPAHLKYVNKIGSKKVYNYINSYYKLYAFGVCTNYSIKK